ncbi:bifunctional aspartate kinase/homoserine dehydrogenase I [Pontimicrobium aquaticum]|uniref:Bifunctional aspartate kinase/homoserine dehydrogenase I n=1 Tax=Pontimicrobium aquaticum TaxID=2565367 RepID=A0A4U0EQB6_9FLAO|nr:bifunctional aspartate kinase/homoserine dehydrogenase I [Pontimicrobium aquaticum]TJY33876.1 bifunctional aspartate kinase/homoserine dehydrogenase I [Pontimicrobium aquaticum]
MKVLKFGGTSVGSAKNILKVITIIKNISQDSDVVVVVSAVGGITDKLLNAANKAVIKDRSYKELFKQIQLIHLDIIEDLIPSEIKSAEVKKMINKRLDTLEKLLEGIYLINELSPKTTDKLLSNGEQMSSFIISEAMKLHGINAELKNSQELVVTDTNYTNATVNFNATNKNIKQYFETHNNSVTLLPGFISKSENGEITTLGRGGSDYTAAIIASALDAKELQIWTDVSGMFTTNPKLVKQAKPISHISYQEAVELSHFGAKVLYPPTVQPVLDKKIPIVIKNTLKPDDFGTYITNSYSNGTTSAVKGISNINDIALLTLQGNGMVGIPGFSKRLFETLSQEKINVILITQASSEHSICIGIQESDAETARAAVNKTFENEISLHKIDPINIEKGLAIVAVVGDRMKNHQGISGRMFSTLGKNNVNIRAIAQGASERNISTVISKKDVKKALNVLHERFFETKTKQLNLFITGVGNVGERLVEQIKQQKKYIKERLKLNLRVVGLSNSRKMILDDDAIDLKNWKALLENGEAASIEGFFEGAKNMNLRNSVFVDVTANHDVANSYANYLRESIGVIACNKIACSSDFDNYNLLKRLSVKYNAPFLFETNVGAGLPVIDTLNHLVASGDEIHSIQAVLSGSLNFVFNNFDNSKKFHDVVKLAQNEGYTEPDPRIDLSGVDVARKILILARESGTEMNLEDITNQSFLSVSGLASNSVDEFYKTLLEDDAHYQSLYNSAAKNNYQLKYVAEFNDGKAKVGIKEIPEGHPFYNLEGKDNIVMFYTKRYPEQPMIIKGAGAGAEVTASGLFADIIRIANS